MARRAAEVLRRSDMGGGTGVALDLYPHQWSWDTDFISVGPTRLVTSYWRGPVWPVVSWLLWGSLRGVGAQERAEELLRGALDQKPR
jgi:glycogen debranching enzyme